MLPLVTPWESKIEVVERAGGGRQCSHTSFCVHTVHAGDMALDATAEMVATYGEDVSLLVGGSLLTESPDLEANARKFLELAGRKNKQIITKVLVRTK